MNTYHESGWCWLSTGPRYIEREFDKESSCEAAGEVHFSRRPRHTRVLHQRSLNVSPYEEADSPQVFEANREPRKSPMESFRHQVPVEIEQFLPEEFMGFTKAHWIEILKNAHKYLVDFLVARPWTPQWGKYEELILEEIESAVENLKTTVPMSFYADELAELRRRLEPYETTTQEF